MSSRINAYRQAVATRLGDVFPQLRDIAVQLGRLDLDELQTQNIPVPAIRIGVLAADVKPAPIDQMECELSLAAFVITEGKQRDTDAWTLAEALVCQLQPDQLWGIFKMGAAHKIRIQPVLDSKIKAKGVAIIAVEWRQTLRGLDASLFNDDGSLAAHIYNLDGYILNDEEMPAPNDDEDGA